MVIRRRNREESEAPYASERSSGPIVGSGAALLEQESAGRAACDESQPPKKPSLRGSGSGSGFEGGGGGGGGASNDVGAGKLGAVVMPKIDLAKTRELEHEEVRIWEAGEEDEGEVGPRGKDEEGGRHERRSSGGREEKEESQLWKYQPGLGLVEG